MFQSIRNRLERLPHYRELARLPRALDRVDLSVRHRILILLAVILAASMSAYVYLATSVLTREKRTYLRDVNALVANTLSGEVRTHVGALSDRLVFLASEMAGSRGDAPSVRPLVAGDPEILALRVWRRRPSLAFELVRELGDSAQLASAGLDSGAIATSRARYPLPFDAVLAERILVENVSLPTAAPLLRIAVATDDQRTIVAAEVRSDRLLEILRRSTYGAYLVDRRGAVLVHREMNKVLSHSDASSVPVVADALGGKEAQGVREFEGRDGATIAAFSRVGIGRMAVVIEVPRAEVYKASKALVGRSVSFAGFIFCLAFLASLLLARGLTRPLAELQSTMALISQGQFGVSVTVPRGGELAALAEAFNRMSRELSTREAHLAEAQAQLIQSEKLAVLGELGAAIVHEVKNPMMAVMGFAELGSSCRSAEEAQEYFDRVLSGARRANEILQTLLSFARPGKVQLAPLDPAEVLHGTLKLASHHLHLHGITVNTRVDPEVPRVLGNGNQLRQVLLNLIMNAADAMQRAPVKRLDLHLEAEPGGGAAVFRVRDTGEGMTDEVKRNLFRPFFTTRASENGTGLGLSVSRGIVTAHRGALSVESEPGAGATFTIRIPATPIQGESAAEASA